MHHQPTDGACSPFIVITVITAGFITTFETAIPSPTPLPYSGVGCALTPRADLLDCSLVKAS